MNVLQGEQEVVPDVGTVRPEPCVQKDAADVVKPGHQRGGAGPVQREVQLLRAMWRPRQTDGLPTGLTGSVNRDERSPSQNVLKFVSL